MRRHDKKEEVDPNILLWLDKTIQDKSRYNRTLTTSGTVIENHENDHIYLDGGNSKTSTAAVIYIGNNIGIGTKNFSISCDVKITKTTTYVFSQLWSFSGSNSSFGVLSIRVGSGNSVGWYASGNRINDTTVRQLNRWYHHEFKRINNRYELYIDNQLVGTSTYNVSGNWNTADFRIGQNASHASTNNEHMTGYVKNVIIKLI